MKLYEFEGYKILSAAGIESPFFVVCRTMDEASKVRAKLKFPIVGKAQVLSGGRGKAGGVKVISREAQLLEFAREFLGREFLGEKVRFLLFAKAVEIQDEFYVSITYDTVLKKPFLMFSQKGGIGIEEILHDKPGEIIKIYIDPLTGPSKADFKKLPLPFEFVTRLWEAFYKNDCRLLEINPLVRQEGNKLLALDAKIILDDNGLSRHEDFDFIAKGAISAEPSKREALAKKIDEGDYRGSAGSAFLDLDGEIAILASGGGASLLVMDAVEKAGGRSANYTEYSGNPSREKVRKLTKIVLAKDRLSGCLVAGAVANFTDIFETLSGFAEAIGDIRPNYPIVVRRGGPRQEEAYKMLSKLAKREGFDIHLYGPETPISVACQEMVRLSNEYKKREFSTRSNNIVRAKSRTS